VKRKERKKGKERGLFSSATSVTANLGANSQENKRGREEGESGRGRMTLKWKWDVFVGLPGGGEKVKRKGILKKGRSWRYSSISVSNKRGRKEIGEHGRKPTKGDTEGEGGRGPFRS